MRKRTLFFVVGLVVSAFPTLFFMSMMSSIAELLLRSGGRVWISTRMLSGELWLSFNAIEMRVEVPLFTFFIVTFSFAVFLVCLVLLVVEIMRK